MNTPCAQVFLLFNALAKQRVLDGLPVESAIYALATALSVPEAVLLFQGEGRDRLKLLAAEDLASPELLQGWTPNSARYVAFAARTAAGVSTRVSDLRFPAVFDDPGLTPHLPAGGPSYPASRLPPHHAAVLAALYLAQTETPLAGIRLHPEVGNVLVLHNVAADDVVPDSLRVEVVSETGAVTPYNVPFEPFRLGAEGADLPETRRQLRDILPSHAASVYAIVQTLVLAGWEVSKIPPDRRFVHVALAVTLQDRPQVFVGAMHGEAWRRLCRSFTAPQAAPAGKIRVFLTLPTRKESLLVSWLDDAPELPMPAAGEA